jgi:hypothetical protein
MSVFIGFLLLLAGIAASVYFGLWWAFIGGIIQIVQSFQPVLGAPNPNTGMLAFGIFRMLTAGFIGWISFVLLGVPGLMLMGATVRSR